MKAPDTKKRRKTSKRKSAAIAPLNRAIGMTIMALRSQKAISQDSLPKGVGMSRHYLSDLEQGTRIVSVSIIEKICDFFGVSLSAFFSSVEALNRSGDQPENEVPAVEEGLIDVFAAAKLLNVCPGTVRKWAWEGSLSSQKVGKSLFFRKQDVFKLKKARKAALLAKKAKSKRASRSTCTPGEKQQF